MANGWNPLIGIGFTALGVGYLWEAYQRRGAPQTPLGLGRAPSAQGVPGQNVLTVKAGVRTIKFYPAGSIESRMRRIIGQMREDEKDPTTVSEVAAILSEKCPVAQGGVTWCVPNKATGLVDPEKIAIAQLKRLFYALVNPNSPYSMRYIRDPKNYDAFRSSALMRRLPAGDCDDMAIRLGAWLLAAGYSVKCRIVSPRGQPGQWAHIYLVAGIPEGENRRWIALDPTEPQHGFGWEVPPSVISGYRDFSA